MIRINEQIINKVIDKQYYDKKTLIDSVERELNRILLETGGISREVSNEELRVREIILNNLKQSQHKIIGNGIGQNKVSFDDKLFGEKYHFSISLINYKNSELWKHAQSKYKTKTGAEIDTDDHIVRLNIESINTQIIPETFDGSLRHEMQHCYDVKKSEYTWATDDTYKLALKLMNCEDEEVRNDEELNEIIYLIGVLLYISFKGEQSGYANGLYATLMQRQPPKNRNDVDAVSRNDDSFKILSAIRTLGNVLFGKIKTNKLDAAINYINGHTTKNYTKDKLKDMCTQVEHEFCRRVNRAKGEYISSNDGVYEHVLPRLWQHTPLLIENNKIVMD